MKPASEILKRKDRYKQIRVEEKLQTDNTTQERKTYCKRTELILLMNWSVWNENRALAYLSGLKILNGKPVH